MSALPPKADIRHDDPACMHPSKGVPKLDVFHDGLAPESGTPQISALSPNATCCSIALNALEMGKKADAIYNPLPLFSEGVWMVRSHRL